MATQMTLGEFLSSNCHEWEDDEFMVERGHSALHGEPTFKVTAFAHPASGKVYRNPGDVSRRLGEGRVGKAS